TTMAALALMNPPTAPSEDSMRSVTRRPTTMEYTEPAIAAYPRNCARVHSTTRAAVSHLPPWQRRRAADPATGRPDAARTGTRSRWRGRAWHPGPFDWPEGSGGKLQSCSAPVADGAGAAGGPRR